VKRSLLGYYQSMPAPTKRERILLGHLRRNTAFHKIVRMSYSGGRKCGKTMMWMRRWEQLSAVAYGPVLSR